MIPSPVSHRIPEPGIEVNQDSLRIQDGTNLLSLDGQVNLLLADCRPELNSLEGNSLIAVLHPNNSQLEEILF